VVKVIGGGAELKEGRGGRKLLRIKITAEVDGVRREYVMTYGRHGADNAAVGRAYASAGAPGGREADAEEVRRCDKGTDGERAEGVPHERRHYNFKVLRGAPRRLHALYRTRRRCSEVAGGDGPVTIPPHVQTASA
jgi:hypothetical protein